jgi:DNA-binding transcriptional MerR regulator
MPFTFKRWYDDNKEEFNDTRRKRYKTDPEYRERVNAQNRKLREEKKKLREKEKKAETRAIRVRSKALPWKVHTLGSDGTPLFSIGALAKAIGRSVLTIRLWEKRGLIPKTAFLSGKGDRLYTAEMIEEIVERLRSEGRLEEDKVHKGVPKSVVRRVRLSGGEVRRLRLFFVGVMAKALDRALVTIEQMEQKGTFPVSPLRDCGTGRRLYTADMIREARKLLVDKKSDLRGDAGRIYCRELLDQWKKLKVVGAEVLEEEEKDDGQGKQGRRRAS